MHVITRQKLTSFWENHKNAEKTLKAWCADAENARWQSPNDIKARYDTADFPTGERVIFNIKGNTYRIIAVVHYATVKTKGVVYIRFVGTHDEYTELLRRNPDAAKNC